MDTRALGIYDIVGGNVGKVKITDDNTARLGDIIQGLSIISEASACIRALFNRYPEEELLGLAFEKFFELRPTKPNRRWFRELFNLVHYLRLARLKDWETVVYNKVMCNCPELASRLWDDKHPAPIQVPTGDRPVTSSEASV